MPFLLPRYTFVLNLPPNKFYVLRQDFSFKGLRSDWQKCFFFMQFQISKNGTATILVEVAQNFLI